MKYLPLEFLDGSNVTDGDYTDFFLRNKITDVFVEGEKKINEDDLENFVFGGNEEYGINFMNPSYKGVYSKLNLNLLLKSYQMAKMRNNLFEEIERKTKSLEYSREWLDLFVMPIISNRWARTKKVYKIDKDFYEELRRTNGTIEIPREDFNRLPLDTFYIDLEDCLKGKIKGAFVYVYTKSQVGRVEIGMITNDMTWYSYGQPIKEKNFKFDPEPITDDTYKLDFEGKGYLKKDTDVGNRNEIADIVVKIISFLIAENKDIKESNTTKTTYKPKSVKRKNKFSEIQMFDVGITYGKAIRLAKEEVKKEIEKQENEVNKEELKKDEKKKPRKPVRPHIRTAHWQRYHIGVGRKEIVTKWIPPIFVCGDREISVNIQKIKK